jgi:hypothetical protein
MPMSPVGHDKNHRQAMPPGEGEESEEEEIDPTC